MSPELTHSNFMSSGSQSKTMLIQYLKHFFGFNYCLIDWWLQITGYFSSLVTNFQKQAKLFVFLFIGKNINNLEHICYVFYYQKHNNYIVITLSLHIYVTHVLNIILQCIVSFEVSILIPMWCTIQGIHVVSSYFIINLNISVGYQTSNRTMNWM